VVCSKLGGCGKEEEVRSVSCILAACYTRGYSIYLRYWYKSTNTDAEGKDLKGCGMEEVRQGGRGTAAAKEAKEANAPPKEAEPNRNEHEQEHIVVEQEHNIKPPPEPSAGQAKAEPAPAPAADKAAAEKAAAEEAAAEKAAADAKVVLRENTRLCVCVCVVPVCVCVCVCRKRRC
jgi:hypothetical protein